MEQVRVALAWLKQHNFWVLTGLIVLIASVSWYLAINEVDAAFKTNKQKIEAHFSNQSQLQSQAFKPNEKINQQQEAETTKASQSTLTLWKDFHARQQGILAWPELGPNFNRYMKNLKFGEEILDHWRSRYLNYADAQFKEFQELIDAKEDLTGAGATGFNPGGDSEGMFNTFNPTGGAGGADDESLDEDFITLWHDQMRVKQDLTWIEAPSSIKMWVTQEDLWVYKTVLTIVANTNKKAGVKRYSNAKVKEIIALEIGGKFTEKIGQATDRIYVPKSTGTSPGAEMGMMGEGGEFGDEGGGYGEEGGEFGDEGGMYGDEGGMYGDEGAGGGEGNERQTLLGGRYVDSNGRPIRMVGEGTDLQVGKEYKQLPVRIVLKMDHRWLPFLITQCANAPLPIEIKEVRINPQKLSSSGGGGEYGGMEMSPGGRFGSNPTFGTGNSNDIKTFNRTPNQVTIELRGKVYIYNEPNEASLTSEEVEPEA